MSNPCEVTCPNNIPVIMGQIELYKVTDKPGRVKHYQEYAKEVLRRLWAKPYLDLDKLFPKLEIEI